MELWRCCVWIWTVWIKPVGASSSTKTPRNRYASRWSHSLHFAGNRPGAASGSWSTGRVNRAGLVPAQWCLAGNVDPELVPFYLLVVGAPTEIPFEFQYLLGIEYAVGRLAFPQAEDYACYARSVVAYEEAAATVTTREIVFWSTRHLGDAATNLSNSLLVRPLAYGTDAAAGTLKLPLHAEAGYRQRGLMRVVRRPEGRY